MSADWDHAECMCSVDERCRYHVALDRAETLAAEVARLTTENSDLRRIVDQNLTAYETTLGDSVAENAREVIADRRLIHIALRIVREGLLPGYREALQEAAILLSSALAANPQAAPEKDDAVNFCKPCNAAYRGSRCAHCGYVSQAAPAPAEKGER